MRTLVRPGRLCTCSNVIRACHSELFQLYGREPTPALEDNRPLPTNTASPSSASVQTALRAVSSFDAESYCSPNAVRASSRHDAMRALSAVVRSPARRRDASASSMWRAALRLLEPRADKHRIGAAGEGTLVPLTDAAECAFVLLLSGRHEEVQTVFLRSKMRGRDWEEELKTIATEEFCSALRLLSFALMSSATVRQDESLHLHEREELGHTLLSFSHTLVVRTPAKEERHRIISCVELLLWSFDWIYHSPHSSGATFGDPIFQRLREASPAWIRDRLFREPSKLQPLPSSAGAKCSPYELRHLAESLAERQDLEELRRLFALCQQYEQTSMDWHIFGLTGTVGEAILRCPGGLKGRHSISVIDYLGTSLRPETLASLGNSRQYASRSRALYWLTHMRGCDAYAALKKTLFHNPPEALGALQSRYGDLLTGDPAATWQLALSATQAMMEKGDSASWRQQLPFTLRLLSDGGNFKNFFDLFREYDARRGGENNLVVAAALGQVMRRTGKWQHYQEVIDLIALAAIPSTDSSEYFLEDACLQTLYALRRERRWQEAAKFYGLLKDVMPGTAQRLFASLAIDCATLSRDGASAAEGLLRLAGVKPSDVPQEVARDLELSLAGDAALRSVDLHAVGGERRKHLIEACRRRGHWQPILTLLQTSDTNHETVAGPGGDGHKLQMAVLQAMERVPAGPAGEEMAVSHDNWTAFLELLPAPCWRDERTLMQLFHTALWNGLLEPLQRKLNSSAHRGGTTGLASEVSLLIEFLLSGSQRRTGESPPPDAAPPTALQPVSNSLIGHYYTSFLTSRQYRVALSPSLGTDRGALAKRFRVPPFCIAQSGKPALSFLRPYPSDEAVRARDILFASRDFVVVNKPSGASVQSVGRSALTTLGVADAAFYPAYLIPTTASGLCIFFRASANAKRFVFDLTLQAPLVSLGDACVPVLSAQFFSTHSMRLADVTERADAVQVYALLHDLTAQSGTDAIRDMKRRINEEGWSYAERDVESGETYSVCTARLFDSETGTWTTISLV